MSIAAIIVAAGESRRMGFDKLSAKINGTSVLMHSINAFCQCPSVNVIYVVCNEQRYREIDALHFGKQIFRVDGGAHRQDSVNNGLHALDPEVTLVAIHDGARPMITPELIEKTIAATRQYGAAAVARRVTETLKRSDADGFARTGVDRNNLWYMETPQCFRVSVLRRAYQYVQERGITVTDEVSAVENIGISTFLIESTKPNIKITVPADLELTATLMTD
jgi:2-C-methyl-D-erythritol 4-phosphate cytidylyltransferase